MRHLLPILACAALAAAEPATGPQLVFDITLVDGSGDKPMLVAWVEKTDGTFVRTLHWFSKDKKYYKDLTVWAAAQAGKEDAKAVDAVVGPTIAWGQQSVVKVPAADLLGGDMVLRVEQAKDKGGHYKKIKVPITKDWPGVTISGKEAGYCKTLVVTIEP